MARLHEALAAPVHALPLDVFRVLAGAVLFVYFLQALRQARDFSDPDGLIDHGLCAKLLPPTRWSLFQPGMPGSLFRVAYVGACAASLCVAVGFHPRVAAAYLFLVASSSYRWNVLAAYLDDAIVHVVCLWLVLLPVGTTLVLLPDLAAHAVADPGVAGGASALSREDWLAATVPGAAPRAFMANMALVYVVAGLYKFASPMWRNGSAMHAALKMPVSRAPEFWTLAHRPFLRAVTWAALVLEPLFALVFVLPDGSPAKWVLGAGAAVFHLGIVATLKIPYSNLLMFAALAVPFGPETTGLGGPDAVRALAAPPPLSPAEYAALALVAALVLMFVWEAVRTRTRLGQPWAAGAWSNPVCPVLWLAGVFQSYRLFDWVDDRNYHVRYELRRLARPVVPPVVQPSDPPPGPPPSRALFPNGMRYLLLQSYLIGNVWLQLDERARAAVRRSLLIRHAGRFARLHAEESGDLEIYAVVQRVTADNLDLTRPERRFLMRFSYRDGKAVMGPASLRPDAPRP